MTSLRDAEAIIVSTRSFESSDETDVIQSNASVVNALLSKLLRVDELAPDAVRSHSVDYFHAQVMNGGFSQFVYNSRWNEQRVGIVRAGLRAMNAAKELAAFEAGARVVEGLGGKQLEHFFASAYFGHNPTRDAINAGFDASALGALRSLHARWLRAHPNLVVASTEEIEAEVRRRAAVLPDRAERESRARANEPRDLKLIRALCERAGHEFERRTAAALLTYGGQKRWGYFFRTDRGAHAMVDLDTTAVMFPTSAIRRPGEVVEAGCAIAEIACEPATADDH